MDWDPATEGSVALVTGASGGLGAAVCSTLDALGFRVAVHWCTNEEAAGTVAARLENAPIVVRADLADWTEVDAMYQQAAALGPIDVVVNSAATRAQGLLARASVDTWRRSIEVNLLGAFHVSRACLTPMLRRRRGRLVHVVSAAGQVASPGQTAYSASKGGVIAMVRSLAAECGRRNVTVNALAPGWMETAMTAGASPIGRARVLERVALGRSTTPEEVAGAVSFLLANGYVTGQVIAVDGGLAI